MQRIEQRERPSNNARHGVDGSNGQDRRWAVFGAPRPSTRDGLSASRRSGRRSGRVPEREKRQPARFSGCNAAAAAAAKKPPRGRCGTIRTVAQSAAFNQYRCRRRCLGGIWKKHSVRQSHEHAHQLPARAKLVRQPVAEARAEKGGVGYAHRECPRPDGHALATLSVIGSSGAASALTSRIP